MTTDRRDDWDAAAEFADKLVAAEIAANPELAAEAELEAKLARNIINLGYPCTLPSNLKEGYELLRVIVDTTDYKNHKIHVTIAYEGTYAEAWGANLAEVALAMAKQHVNYLETDREDGDLVAAIRDGFNEAFDQGLGRLGSPGPGPARVSQSWPATD